jgi:hypothetical protein
MSQIMTDRVAVRSRTAIQSLAVVALLVTGLVHLALVPEHFEEAAYSGWLFLADSVAALALVPVLLRSDRRLGWLAAGLLGGLTVAAYVLSRTAGLPGLADDIGQWTEPLSFPALAAEVTLVAAALARLSGSVTEWASPRSRGR